MASARRVGASEQISTYGAGQDYTVLATWEAATDNDNVTGTVSPVLECLAAEYDDRATLSGATNDATYFRIIRPRYDASHNGIRDEGVRFYSTADNFGIILDEGFTQIQDVCLRTTNNSATARSGAAIQGSTSGAFIGCIFTNSQNAGAAANTGWRSTGTNTNTAIVDCIAENNEGRQIVYFQATGTVIVYNCTAIANNGANTVGADLAGGTMIATNVLSQNAGAGAAFGGSGTTTMTNCASDDASAAGTAPRINQTFTFVNAAGDDYHLSGDDVGAKGFGADLSGDATYPFDDDIDRQRRGIGGTLWDIGADFPMPPFILSP